VAITTPTTPTTPPRADSTTASIRNCSSTSLTCAPTASHRPISRVRSVTLTSMMFMMPMPPGSSRRLACSGALSLPSSIATRSVLTSRLPMPRRCSVCSGATTTSSWSPTPCPLAAGMPMPSQENCLMSSSSPRPVSPVVPP